MKGADDYHMQTMTDNDTGPMDTRGDRLRDPATTLTAIGLMSGTSMDGIDVALIETDGAHVSMRGPFATYPYRKALRARLKLQAGQAPEPGPALEELVRDVTDAHAEAVEDFAERAGIDLAGVDLIGFHGQTVFHDPAAGLTCQLGDGARLAARLGTPVVNDFRSADVAAGGEGAPLAPLYHAALAGNLDLPVCILNMGGVGNLTWISADGAVIAFDTGPANALVDDWMAHHTGEAMDADGHIARKGKVDDAALADLLDDAYFGLPFPKSLDRDHFSRRPVDGLSLEDGAATLVRFSAAAVARAQALLPAPPLRWLVTGGGRHNPALMAALRAELGRPVEPVEAVDWHGDALEAQAFAFLAVRSARALPLSLPTTTGVAEPLTGGVLSFPDL